MQSIEATLLQSQALKNSLGSVQTSSDKCFKHIPPRYKNATVDELQALRERFGVQKIMYKGNEVCPRCKTEQATNELASEVSKEAALTSLQHNAEILEKKSIITDQTLIDATFENYQEYDEEETRNKQAARGLVTQLKNGHVHNVWFQSKRTGVGKSHLAMAMLKALNGPTCSTVFIEIQQMLSLIRDSFNNKDSQYTEQYFMDLISRVDIVAIDDLGAETGNVDSQREASEYTSKVLKAIMNARQGKTTILTTNYSTEQLNKIYDAKAVSRLMTNVKTIRFERAIDKRPIQAKLKNLE